MDCLSDTATVLRWSGGVATPSAGKGFGTQWLFLRRTTWGELTWNRRQILLEVVLWIFALFLAWVFVRQGIAKFSNTSGWAKAFNLWHFPVWFRVGIGVAETAAAALLLWKRTALVGATIIIVVMIGAMGTHVWWGHPEQVTSEILPLVLATAVAVGRRKSFLLRRPTEATR